MPYAPPGELSCSSPATIGRRMAPHALHVSCVRPTHPVCFSLFRLVFDRFPAVRGSLVYGLSAHLCVLLIPIFGFCFLVFFFFFCCWLCWSCLAFVCCFLFFVVSGFSMDFSDPLWIFFGPSSGLTMFRLWHYIYWLV